MSIILKATAKDRAEERNIIIIHSMAFALALAIVLVKGVTGILSVLAVSYLLFGRCLYLPLSPKKTKSKC